MVFISSETEYSSGYASAAAATQATAGPQARKPSVPTQTASLALPLIQSDAFVSQRHEVNPAIALNLLQEIQAAVTTWQIQQRQIIQAMQALYAQGPMVDGWLQSSLTVPPAASSTASSEATVLRHGDTDALMQYVEAMENSAAQVSTPTNEVASHQVTSDVTQYLLCSLATDGSVRSQPCPPEQMAVVSTAIARHQKFKQLLAQKQAVEAKLAQTVSQLTQVRAGVRECV